DNRIRLGNGLETRGEVRSITYCSILLRDAFANQVADDNNARGNANTRLKRYVVIALYLFHGINNGQSCTNGTFGIILMRDGVTKIGQHSVTEVLRHGTVKALDLVRTARLESAHEITLFFRVQLR